MNKKIIIFSSLLLLLNVNPALSVEWHTIPEKWKEPRLVHQPFETTFENRIIISRIPLNKTTDIIIKKYSPNKAYWFTVDLPDTMKEGPWSAQINVFNERDYLVAIKIIDYAAQYVTPMYWINEKLLYVQLWWGRILGSYFIFDVENEKILVKEMFYDGGAAFEQQQQFQQKKKLRGN